MAALASGQSAPVGELRSVRAFSGPEASRIVLELSRETRWKYGRLSNPERLFVDLLETRPKLGPGRVHAFPVGDARVQRARVALKDPRTTRVVLDLKTNVDFEFSQLTNPERLVIEVRVKGARRPAETLTQTEPRATPTAPASAGETTAREQRTASASPASAAAPLDAAPAARAERSAGRQGPAARESAQAAAPHTDAFPAPQAAAGKDEARRATDAAPRARSGAAVSGAGKAASGAPGAPPASPQAESPSDRPGPAQSPTAGTPAEAGPRGAEATAGAKAVSPRPEPAPDKPKPAAAETASQGGGAAARPEIPSPKPEPVQVARAAAPAEAAPRDTRAAARLDTAAARPEATAGARKAASGSAPAAAAPLPAEPARPTRKGDRSLTRALGLHIGRIVLDPGHGGHDQGTRGPTGLLEKDLVLDVALRLGALLEERLGAEVVYTRKTDVFLPLEERTAIANEHRADLFLSIHANSSPSRRVSGAEVFYLNFTTSKEALDLAARENAGHGRSIFELRELIQKIALKDKLDESREFAGFMQQELSREWRKANPAARNRGVKTAPFVVLIGASMPSVLAEIGFLSNPRDEAMLRKPEYRQRLAESLFRGIERYARSLGQTQALRAATAVEAVQSTR